MIEKSVGERLDSISQAIERESVPKNWLYRVVSRLFGWEKKRLRAIVQMYEMALDQLESEKVYLGEKRGEYDKAIEIFEKFKPHVRETARRVIALRYRIGLDPLNEAALDERLQNLVKQWKAKQPWPEGVLGKDLDAEDREVLSQVGRYPEFVKLLLEDAKLSGEFFKWALQSKNSVDVFVQYPALCRRLKRSLIYTRTGFYSRRNYLNIETRVSKKGLQKKVVTLPFYTDAHKTVCKNILKEKKVIPLEGGSLTIKQIFDEFGKKNVRPAELECFEVGLRLLI